MKTNYDGAMFAESNMAGIGVVVCNSDGRMLVALFEQIMKPPTVEILKLLVARHAVSFHAVSSYDQFVCEGHSEFVVNSLR